MMPIHELLARIRWDSAFGRGQFMLGYLDHDSEELRYVPFKDAQTDPDNASMLDLVGECGEALSLPLHRIYQVLRNGELVWQREMPPHAHASLRRHKRP